MTAPEPGSNTLTWSLPWSENVRQVWRLLGVHLDRNGRLCVAPLAINGHAYRRRVLSRRGRP